MTSMQDVPGRHFRAFHRAVVNCSTETAWDVFTNQDRIADFMSAGRRVVKEGETERHGLGAITEPHPAPAHMRVREMVNYWVPHRVYGWHQIDPEDHRPSHHQGVVRFFPQDENRCEWVYDMRIIITPRMEELAPGLRSGFLEQFREMMWDYESECERRGHEIEIPAFPAPVADPG